ncbi:hypothetical protein TNIN_307301 [Trichonephila inaurata madagascariensis]|uniref:Transposase n=1 Tax=Trichonephila inaurata madagascariensis TaxID=2747483 RepID=A0A8X7BN16_9ARAC|nr:hypothetical protein TNIN_307301 [Trichonephila inaurata madagascariensis]
MEKLQDLGYGCSIISPYSPDLAPSDLHSVPKREEIVYRKRVVSNEKLRSRRDEYFHRLPDSHFQEGILMFEKRWTKCVKVKRLCRKIKFELKIAIFHCQVENFSPYPRITSLI